MTESELLHYLRPTDAKLCEAEKRITELEAALGNALEGCRHYRMAGTVDGLRLARQYEDNARAALTPKRDE